LEEEEEEKGRKKNSLSLLSSRSPFPVCVLSAFGAPAPHAIEILSFFRDTAGSVVQTIRHKAQGTSIYVCTANNNTPTSSQHFTALLLPPIVYLLTHSLTPPARAAG
jgi:hypothetical protein